MMPNVNGFTLLEIIISLFLLSIVLLGVDAAQVLVMRDSRGIYYFNQASVMAANMAEYLVAHHGDTSGYERKWQLKIAEILPISSGYVSRSQSSHVVKVWWGGESRECRKTKQGVKGCVVLNVPV